MFARAENRKGNVVSKTYMYNRTIFMLKYIVLVMEDALNKYRYIPKILTFHYIYMYMKHIYFFMSESETI